MKELTKAEEQVMQVLWGLKKGFVNDYFSNNYSANKQGKIDNIKFPLYCLATRNPGKSQERRLLFC